MGKKTKLRHRREDSVYDKFEHSITRIDIDDFLRALPYPMIIINTDNYRIEFVNESARRAGYLTGSFCYQHHKRNEPCRGKNHTCHLNKVKRTGESIMTEHIHYDSSGNKTFIEIHAYPILDDNGRVGRVIETMLDITYRKMVEAKLAQLRKKLMAGQIRLRNKNIAIKELVDNIADEKQLIVNLINKNVNMLIKPLIKNLYSKTNAQSYEYIAQLERSLQEITSPYIDQLESQFSSLSPREIEISYMVRSGMTSKDIASTLSISPETVNWYRKAIRKKLGLVKVKTRLSVFLGNYK